MKCLFQLIALVVISNFLPACTHIPSDHSAPVISDITTSAKVVVISDCQNTSVTVSAKVTDESRLNQVRLWYRIAQNGQFVSLPMNAEKDKYSVELKGADLQGSGYGTLEFYISAQDEPGNEGKSQHDTSVQFLPCVSS